MSSPAVLRFGDFQLDRHSFLLLRGGEPVPMQPKALELLFFLAERPGRMFDRDELVREVWQGVKVTDQSLTQAIRRIRTALKDDPDQPRYLETVARRGYRFIAPVERAEPAPAPVAAPAVQASPVPEDGFIGRTKELAEIHSHFQAGIRLLTLHGPGGIGKTRLARRYLDQAGGSPLFVELAAVRGLGDLLFALARSLALPLRGGDEGESSAQVGRALGERGPLLLVLDNWDHLVELAPPTLGRWLELAPQARFLATSRVRLGLPGEHLLPVGPLQPEDALMLFRERAARTGRPLSPDPATQALIARTLEELDHNTLAIELAAARMAILSPAELQARVSDRFRLLRGTPGGRGGLEETIAWSWELLSPGDRRALLAMSLFRGSFSLSSAEAVLDPDDPVWALDRLQDLADRSLLVASLGEEGGSRYRLHQNVRAFCLSRLAVDPGGPGLRQRYVSHVVELAERLSAEAESRCDAASQAALEQVLPDVIEASAIAEDLSILARLALAPARMLALRGPMALLRPLLERALPVREPSLRVRILLLAAELDRRCGPGLDAPQQIEEALATEIGDPALQAEALLGRALDHQARGRAPEALGDADAALAAARAGPTGNPTLVARILALRMEALRQLGRSDEVLLAGEEALAAAPSPAGRNVRAQILSALAVVRAQRGELALAELRYRDALALHQEAGSFIGEALIRANLATLAGQAGRMEEAEQDAEGALAILRQLGELRNAAAFTVNLSAIRLFAGDLAGAEKMATEARAYALSAGNAELRVVAELNLGTVARARGRQDDASQLLESARDGARTAGLQRLEGWCAAGLVAVEAAQGALKAARRELEEAHELLTVADGAVWALVRSLLEGHIDLARLRAGEAPRDEILSEVRDRLDRLPAKGLHQKVELEARMLVESLQQALLDKGLR